MDGPSTMPSPPLVPVPETRARYRRFLPIPTRWMDNDIYGHVNNVVYYSYFDTVINRYLIDEGGLDIAAGNLIGLCVESHCAYVRPVAFPDELDAGVRVAHLGKSSVRYEVGIFTRGADEASAHGWFVHVFVDRATRRPSPLSDRMREALERIKA
jgi:acyl-CoA thioester hydrolase